MDTINGIDFENWAAACGNLAQGMPEEEICNILGIELPVWQETTEKWAAKLGDLMAEDMNVATTYGEIFANPKVGKFASVASNVPTLDDVLKIAPDFESYQKIFWQQSKASEVGIDAVSVLEENGLTLQTWGQLNMHYMNWRNDYMASDLHDTNPVEYKKRYDFIRTVDEKWQSHWENYYKDHAVDLGSDIDF